MLPWPADSFSAYSGCGRGTAGAAGAAGTSGTGAQGTSGSLAPSTGHIGSSSLLAKLHGLSGSAYTSAVSALSGANRQAQQQGPPAGQTAHLGGEQAHEPWMVNVQGCQPTHPEQQHLPQEAAAAAVAVAGRYSSYSHPGCPQAVGQATAVAMYAAVAPNCSSTCNTSYTSGLQQQQQQGVLCARSAGGTCDVMMMMSHHAAGPQPSGPPSDLPQYLRSSRPSPLAQVGLLELRYRMHTVTA